ncbi:MAG: hypothetical protein K0R44_1122 [Thermomicrobiales bacterium]|nr:hypothetical protein [Thermomicrobiales bacterium]
MAISRSLAIRTSRGRPASVLPPQRWHHHFGSEPYPGCATSTVASSVARAHLVRTACANPSPSGVASSSGCASKRRLMPSVYISKSHSGASAISTGRTLLAETRFDVASSGHDELTSRDIDRSDQQRRATSASERLVAAIHRLVRVERRLGRESGDRGQRGSGRLRPVTQAVDEGNSADRPMPVDLPGIATDGLTRIRASSYRNGDGQGSHLRASMDVPDGLVTIVKSSIRRRTPGSPLPSPPLVL